MCGWACNWLRPNQTYITKARIFFDSAEEVTIRWRPADKNAPIYYGEQFMDPLVWSPEIINDGVSIGEVPQSKRTYNRKPYNPAPFGDCVVRPASVANGLSIHDVENINDVPWPECCNQELECPFVDIGQYITVTCCDGGICLIYQPHGELYSAGTATVTTSSSSACDCDLPDVVTCTFDTYPGCLSGQVLNMTLDTMTHQWIGTVDACSGTVTLKLYCDADPGEFKVIFVCPGADPFTLPVGILGCEEQFMRGALVFGSGPTCYYSQESAFAHYTISWSGIPPVLYTGSGRVYDTYTITPILGSSYTGSGRVFDTYTITPTVNQPYTGSGRLSSTYITTPTVQQPYTGSGRLYVTYTT